MHLTTDNLNYPAGYTPMTQKLGDFDPFVEMMKCKYQEDNLDIDLTVPQHNEDDVKELEDFCLKHGIVGFNCGRMNPKAALQMLKSKIGYREPAKKQVLNG